MSSRSKIFAIASAAMVLAVIGAIVSRATPPNNPDDQLGWTSVDQRAAALHGDDEALARALAASIVQNVAGETPALDVITQPTIDRITRTELAFQRGQRRGVNEQDVAQAVNHLATVFDAPGYARTNKWEVRGVRRRALLVVPHLIGSHSAASGRRDKGSIDDEMSPSEAAYVFASLAAQKVYNPDFQLTPDERRTKFKETRSRRWQDRLSYENGTPPRVQEMIDVITTRGRQMSTNDLQQASDRCLDLMGMER
ncbi:MAG TPA: hypothetical protein VFA60_06660 [Terriglobales bacterium]|nr:hypothetical protein [Terriglobales bacterium]